MATLSSAKTLGGVGSILLLLGAAPSVGFALAIAGFVMVLVAVKYISDLLTDKSIFNNMLIAVILGIIGVATAGLLVVGSVLRFIGLGYTNFGPGSVSTAIPTDVVGLLVALVLGLIVAWVFLLVSSVFLRRSFTTIANRLGVGMFSTAGLLFLIGAALAIIIIGFALIFVAEILMIVAFFSLPDQVPGMQTPAPMPSG
ncbi:MAG: DUF996 domain-containing protein [Thaumarchaeota archaeon]|nr:DUF996 domain-containing protein [Nitrososphaerota archaeon]